MSFFSSNNVSKNVFTIVKLPIILPSAEPTFAKTTTNKILVILFFNNPFSDCKSSEILFFLKE